MTGWAILGAGGVSSRFAVGLRALGRDARIVAVASRDPANARAFARKHGGTATDYAAAVAMDGVDAVYVATPPSLHEEHATLGILAGKAVLIEKPFAQDAEAAQRIVDAVRDAGVFCMEAMWTRFLPAVTELRGQAESLGELRRLSASFMGSDVPDASVSLFDPGMGGGALRHRGVYGLSLARMLLGPATVAAAVVRRGETGVDEECTVVLRHQGGALSTVTASLRAPGVNGLVLSGTRGMVELFPPLYRPSRGRRIDATPRRGGSSGASRLAGLRDGATAQAVRQRLPWLGRGKGLFRPYAGNGYHYEAAEVARQIAAGGLESPVMPLDESIEVLRLVDAATAMFADGA